MRVVAREGSGHPVNHGSMKRGECFDHDVGKIARCWAALRSEADTWNGVTQRNNKTDCTIYIIYIYIPYRYVYTMILNTYT